MLSFRHLIQRNNWTLNWNARSSNKLAYGLAKRALTDNCTLNFYPEVLDALPHDLSNLLIADMISGGASF